MCYWEGLPGLELIPLWNKKVSENWEKVMKN